MSMTTGVDVEWGRNKIPLRFDLYPYEGGPDHPYEPEVINAYEHFVEPGDFVIDAGASVGYHTCLLSKMVGDGGVVLAFEPHLDSFRYLGHHVHVANHLGNVACFRTALWKFDCPALELWSVKDLGYSSLHRYIDAEKSEVVEGRALDTLLTSDHPRLIKIDCEGVEAEILCGAHKILERGVDCVILEFNYHLLENTKRSDHVIRRYMQDLGYDMFLINLGDGNGGFLPPLKVDPERTITLSGGHHINVLFSTEEKVAQRWQTTKNI